MIEIIFYLGKEIILVRVDGTHVFFANSKYGGRGIAQIDGLRLNREGVEKKFPDLKGDEQWREKAIQRFKDHIVSLPTEEARVTYIIEDFKQWGYVPKYKQKKGFRIEPIK